MPRSGSGAPEPRSRSRHAPCLSQARSPGKRIDAGFGFETFDIERNASRTHGSAPGKPARYRSTITTRAEREAMLIDSFVHRLGADRVRRLASRASHVPEQAGGIATARAGPAPPQQNPLHRPKALSAFARSPKSAKSWRFFPKARRKRFRWRGVMRNVAQADGPERIADEWWRNREARPISPAIITSSRTRSGIASGFIAKACRIATRICHAGSCMASLRESAHDRLCRTRRRHQFLLPARRLASAAKWSIAPANSALPPSALPIATALPAWCALTMRRSGGKDIRLLVGTRLVTLEGFEAIAYPTDRAAYGRLCRLLSDGNLKAKKGECHLSFEDVLAASDGQMLIALPPRSLDDDFALRLASLARNAHGRVFLGATNHLHGDAPRRLRLLAELADQCGAPLVAINDALYHRPERRRLPISSPASARNAPLPKRASAWPSMPSATSNRPTRWRGSSPSAPKRSPAASKSPRPAAFHSTNSNTNIPTSRCRPARRRSNISPI